MRGKKGVNVNTLHVIEGREKKLKWGIERGEILKGGLTRGVTSKHYML